MDAASYAAQKQQLQAEQFQRLMQMFMAARQNQQDQGWQREQFNYKQQQDAQANAMSAAEQKSREGYYGKTISLQEREQQRLEAKAKQDAADKKREFAVGVARENGWIGPSLGERAKEAETMADATAKGRGVDKYAPKDDGITAAMKNYEFTVKQLDELDKNLAAKVITPEHYANARRYLLGEDAAPKKTDWQDKFHGVLKARGFDDETIVYYMSNPEQFYLDYPDAKKPPVKGGPATPASTGYVTADGKPVPAGIKVGTGKETGKKYATIGGVTVEVFPAK